MLEVGLDAVVVWFTLPPLTQPLAIALGPLFMLLESPRMGRFYAMLSMFGIFNAIVAMLAILLAYGVDSWLFEIGICFITCVVKTGLLVLASLHASNLEIARDAEMASYPDSELDWLLLASRG